MLQKGLITQDEFYAITVKDMLFNQEQQRMAKSVAAQKSADNKVPTFVRSIV
jgi:hypothetical protein